MCGISHICLFHFAVICFLSLLLRCVWIIAAAFILFLSLNVFSLGQYSIIIAFFHTTRWYFFLSMFLKYIFSSIMVFSLPLNYLIRCILFHFFPVYIFFHFSKSVKSHMLRIPFLSQRHMKWISCNENCFLAYIRNKF